MISIDVQFVLCYLDTEYWGTDRDMLLVDDIMSDIEFKDYFVQINYPSLAHQINWYLREQT